MDEALYKLNNGRVTLRNPLDCSVLSHSLNRRICGYRSCRPFVQIALSGNFPYPTAVIRNFEDRFIGKFIVTFELSEGGIPREHWAF